VLASKKARLQIKIALQNHYAKYMQENRAKFHFELDLSRHWLTVLFELAHQYSINFYEYSISF